MTSKIKCSYVAEGEPFTLGKEYDIYFSEGDSVFYIKDDNGIRFEYPREDGYKSAFDGLLAKLNDDWHSYFITSYTPDEEPEPEKDIKKEVHELLDKVVDLVYNNQEELDISLDDFVTLIRIKEDLK